jgi:hypothetical protein
MVAESPGSATGQRNPETEDWPIGGVIKARLFAAIVFLLTASCAEIGPPPGGEEDKAGPTLLESTPASGALGVVAGDEVVLVFSEELVKPEQGTAIFVSPRPVRQPRVEWKGDRLRILFDEPLLPDRTYVITVNTTVADLRRNRLDSAVTVAFSTGQTIDTGLVAGRVLTQDGKPATGWTVGLYPLADFEGYALTDSLYPEYLTATSGNGAFTLSHLPSAAFRLVAFQDKNRDDLFNPSIEPFALPDRDILVSGGLPLDRLYLTGVTPDSLEPEIISVVTTEDDLIRMRLSRAIDPSYLIANYSETVLKTISDSLSTEVHCGGVLESDLPQTSVLTAYFPEISDGIFQLALKYKPDSTVLVRDSVTVKRQPDKTAPEIVSYLPGDKPLFVNQVRTGLTWSEPIDRAIIGEQSLLLREDSLTLVPITLEWSDAFHLNLAPQKLNAGRKYRLDVSEFDFRDSAGNRLGDSLRSFRFVTLDADSVGSVSGQVSVTIPPRVEETAVLSFQNTVSRSLFTVELASFRTGTTAAPRLFSLEVPPGKYLVSGFLDADGNGKFTPGSIDPYRASETQAFFADTVAVRARFETAGVEFSFD